VCAETKKYLWKGRTSSYSQNLGQLGSGKQNLAVPGKQELRQRRGKAREGWRKEKLLSPRPGTPMVSTIRPWGRTNKQNKKSMGRCEGGTSKEPSFNSVSKKKH